MIKYSIEKISDKNNKHQNLFDLYWSDMISRTAQMIFDGFITYSVNAKDGDKLVGTNGIIKLDEATDPGPFAKNHYAYFYTLVHPDYRNQGICNGILRMTTKFLIEMGADKIRVDKSSSNTVKHEIFTDMGFELFKYHPEKTEFKNTYELDVSKADINKLNEIWSEYVS